MSYKKKSVRSAETVWDTEDQSMESKTSKQQCNHDSAQNTRTKQLRVRKKGGNRSPFHVDLLDSPTLGVPLTRRPPLLLCLLCRSLAVWVLSRGSARDFERARGEIGGSLS